VILQESFAEQLDVAEVFGELFTSVGAFAFAFKSFIGRLLKRARLAGVGCDCR
jgi:hypothetical protein